MSKSPRKTAILEVAARLFNEKGFNAVSMRDLASTLEIKASSLYNHISSKEEILSDIILSIGSQFTDGMQTIVSDSTDIIVTLEQIIHMHVNIAVRHSDEIGVLNKDWIHLPEPAKSQLIAMRHDYENNFRSVVLQGIEEGRLIRMNPEIMLFSILSTLRSIHAWYRRKGDDDISVLTTNIVNILLNGITAK